jgi:hypothetical protein
MGLTLLLAMTLDGYGILNLDPPATLKTKPKPLIIRSKK